MSLTEILVVIGGLALGYWVVSRLIDDLNRNEKDAPGDPAGAETPATAAGLPAPWHEVLKISRGATPEEIQRAYRYLMQQYHPDKVATLGDELKAVAERKSREINAAYEEAMRQQGARH